MPITTSSQSFTSFANGWLIRHRHFVEQLTCASSFDETNRITLQDQQFLVTQFLTHCLQYYQEKSSAVSVAGDNVFTFFSPPLQAFAGVQTHGLLRRRPHSPPERPDLESPVGDEEERERRDARLRAGSAERGGSAGGGGGERSGGEGMVDGEESDLEEAMEVLKNGMAAAMNSADELRCATVGKVVEILTTSQAVKVLRTIGELHLRLRELVGLESDQE
ncbi:RESPONSE TO ABA AND SALT 1 [Raphanus sativus]|nr:RESPONSE TO ABA AND SALT 1 [Raphanus sativus]